MTDYSRFKFPVLALLLAAAALVTVRAEVIEQVLVKINGEILTKTDLETRQVGALRQMGKIDQNNRPSDAQLRDMLNEVTPRLLVNFVDEVLLVQRAKDLGLKLTDEQFKAVVENLKKENKLETEEQFVAALKQENMTLADLRNVMERQQLSFLVRRREVIERLSVSDEETRRYYDAHTAEFSTQPSVTLREVLVTVPSGGPEDAAKEKADAVRKRALAGEDFAKLAETLSDAPSRANGGLVGPINLSDLAENIQTTVGAMKAGDVGPVTRTATGFQILKVETIVPKQTLPFDEARNQISDKVFSQKQQEELKKYMEKLRAAAAIDWKSPELKKAYELGLTQADQAGG